MTVTLVHQFVCLFVCLGHQGHWEIIPLCLKLGSQDLSSYELLSNDPEQCCNKWGNDPKAEKAALVDTRLTESQGDYSDILYNSGGHGGTSPSPSLQQP